MDKFDWCIFNIPKSKRKTSNFDWSYSRLNEPQYLTGIEFYRFCLDERETWHQCGLNADYKEAQLITAVDTVSSNYVFFLFLFLHLTTRFFFYFERWVFRTSSYTSFYWHHVYRSCQFESYEPLSIFLSKGFLTQYLRTITCTFIYFEICRCYKEFFLFSFIFASVLNKRKSH